MDDNLNTPSDGDTSGDGNWEARFKGLQRKYQDLEKLLARERSRLESEVEQVKSQLEGARANNATLNTRISDLEGERGRVATQHEQAISELQSQLSQAQEQSQTFQAEIEETKAQLAAQEADLRVRKMLTNPEYSAVAPFYDAGLMGDLSDLDEETLTERLSKAKELIGDRKLQNFAEQMSGTTPPPPSGDNSPPTPELKDVDAMQEWLSDPQNAASEQWEAVREKYLTALEKQQTT